MSLDDKDALKAIIREQMQAEEAKRKPAREKKGLWGMLAALGVLLAKFLKPVFILFKFFKFAKFFMTAGSMVLTIWLYAHIWGWPFAVGFVLLIFVHELGHAIDLWYHGVPAGVPVFIPFVGAFISIKEMPKNVAIEAESAFAGPFFGTLAALLAFAIAQVTHHGLWLALAYSGFLINLFNLLPILPLDGGRVAAGISPKIWVLGLLGAVALLFYRFNVIIIILILLSLPRVWNVFRGKFDPAYYEISPSQRRALSLCYFGLALFLGVMVVVTRQIPP